MLNVLRTIAFYGKFGTKSPNAKQFKRVGKKASQPFIMVGWIMIWGRKVQNMLLLFQLGVFCSVFQLFSLSGSLWLCRSLASLVFNTFETTTKKSQKFVGISNIQKNNNNITILSHMPND